VAYHHLRMRDAQSRRVMAVETVDVRRQTGRRFATYEVGYGLPGARKPRIPPILALPG
jgi:hypothetical protein